MPSIALPLSVTSFKVLFAIAGLHPESGGPSRSVPALCEALGHHGVKVEVVSLDYGPGFGEPLIPSRAAAQTTLVSCSSALERCAQWTPRFKSAIRDRSRNGDVQLVHDTGLWLLTNHAVATVCREFRIPRIVSPRGMLSSWALRFKGLKKRIAWVLYQRRDLQCAQVLHATSPEEAREFRAVGLRQAIAVVPNGIEVPDLSQKPRAESKVPFALRPSPFASRSKVLLYLGRIHPIKGLPDLLCAWASVRPQGWRVVVAGRDEGCHQRELEALARQLHIENDFEFAGQVAGEARWELYRGADLFVLPSYSENFGLVVGEALACGVPVITTRATPWEELETHRCGWCIDVGAEHLALALGQAIGQTDEERREMGARGRQLVETRYSWLGVAEQMHAVYCWALGQGPKPDCVVSDG